MPLILSPDLDYYGGMDMKHIGDLTPDPRNARKHGERNFGQIERSLEAYGAARSIVVDETGRILAGNGSGRDKSGKEKSTCTTEM
jgi:hypothetical protein